MAAPSRASIAGRTRRVAVTAVVLGIVWPGAGALAADKQLAQFAVEHWRVKDGLPGDSVVALAQATDGQLWIATLGGLAHYDGIRVTRAAGPVDSRLAPLDVRRLLAGADGSVWAGSPYFAPLRFRAGSPPPRSPAGPPGQHGGLGPGCPRRDLGGHRRRAGSHLQWPVLEAPRRWQFDDRAGQGGGGAAPTAAADRLPRATELRFDRAGTAWLGTDRGLFSLAGGRLRRHPGVAATDAVTALHEDRRGIIWVAAGRAAARPGRRAHPPLRPRRGPAARGDRLAGRRRGRQPVAGHAGRPGAAARRPGAAVHRRGRPARERRHRGAGRPRGQPVGGHAQRRPQPVHAPAPWTRRRARRGPPERGGQPCRGRRGRVVVRPARPGRRALAGRAARKYTRADGLPSDQVWTLCPAGRLGGQSGDVWIGTGAGLRRWRAGAIDDPGSGPAGDGAVPRSPRGPVDRRQRRAGPAGARRAR